MHTWPNDSLLWVLIYLSVYPSVCLSDHSSVCIFIYPFVTMQLCQNPAHIRTLWQRTVSLSMDSSINKLTNYQYITAKWWWVCFCWKSVIYPCVLGYPLNASGWLVQADTLLEITTRLVYDIGNGFSYSYFVTVWVQWGLLVGHFTLKIAELCSNLPLYISPPPFTLI